MHQLQRRQHSNCGRGIDDGNCRCHLLSGNLDVNLLPFLSPLSFSIEFIIPLSPHSALTCHKVGHDGCARPLPALPLPPGPEVQQYGHTRVGDGEPISDVVGGRIHVRGAASDLQPHDQHVHADSTKDMLHDGTTYAAGEHV